ncbi:MAG: hypothetical protein A2X94_12705 [Bdellovibrionales bacterium GWB1_55_8]|nr:MAG: hypothetical protein A2X94_12705 [Bdellovibrionales bacterium GWB1_55_8]
MSVYPHHSLRDYAHSYAGPGVVTLILIWAVSGCRFGNYVEYPQNPDTPMGYYETLPQDLNLCVTTNAASQCVKQPANLTPDIPAKIMSDPVMFLVDEANPADAAIVSAFNRNYSIPISFDPATMDLRLLAQPTEEPLSNTCMDRFNVEAQGKLNRVEKYEITVGSQTVSASGRVSLAFRVTESFQGECADTMDALYECYMESASCTNYDPKVVKATFQPYIDAGLMTAEDIANVTDIGYEVSYQ